MSGKSDIKKFLTDLQTDGESYFGSGRSNNILDVTLSVVTVLASLLSACLAVAGAQKWVIALIAAMPAAAASIQSKVGINERADWYFQYAAALRAMATKVEFADPSTLDEYVDERARLEVSMEAEWRKTIRRPSPSRSKKN